MRVMDADGSLCAEDYAGHVAPSNEELREFVSRSRWIFARTMPRVPHEYALRREARNNAEFVRVIKHIRQFGYDARWG